MPRASLAQATIAGGTGSGATLGVRATSVNGSSSIKAVDSTFSFVPYDITPPTVTVDIVDTSLSDTDSTSLVTFEFSETVTGFTIDDVTVSGGTLSALTQVDGNSYTATFTADDGAETTGSVSVTAGSYTDVAGNTGGAGSDTVSIDTKNPTVTVAIDDVSLNDGDSTSVVNFTFSEAVSGFEEGDVTVIGGTLSGFTGSGSSYSATFTATDCAETTGSVSVAAGTYTDVAGNTGGAGSDTVSIDTRDFYPDNVLVGSGIQEEVRLVGDAEVLHGCDVGGNDTITGAFNARKNLIYGDAYEMSGHATGGDDVIVGGVDTESNVYTNTPWLFGNFLYGEAYSMTDNTVGGNDTMTGGANSLWNYIRGDAFVIEGSAQGGNDVLNGGVGTTYARLYGDAAEMYDNSVGGDDELTGSDNADRNLLMGDSFDMLDNTVGGDDHLYGGDNVNTGFYGYDLIYGDAIDVGYVPYGVATGVKGGNDVLQAGDNSKTYMWGDSQTQYGGVAYGGDDILNGGGAGANQFTYMVGDTDRVLGASNMTGGNDRLVSGSGSDYMYGDFAFVAATATAIGGIDTFVFQATNNGNDFVYDFEDNKDKLEFVGLSSGSLAITDDGTNSTITWVGGSVSVFGVTATALSNDLIFT